MGAFEHFPYTNFHEANLDELAKTVGSVDGRIAGMETAIASHTRSINYMEPEVNRHHDDINAMKLEIARKANESALAQIINRIRTLEDAAFAGVEPYSKDEVNTLLDTAMRSAEDQALYKAYNKLGAIINHSYTVQFNNGESDFIVEDIYSLFGHEVGNIPITISTVRIAVDGNIPCVAVIQDPTPTHFRYRLYETTRTSGAQNVTVRVSYLLHPLTHA